MKYLEDVATLKYMAEKCTGCGRCAEVCPHGVFVIREKKAAITDRDKCMECGACASNCAFDAIAVNPGVGCAAAMINGLIRYGDMDKGTCGCSSDGDRKKGCC